MALVPLGLGAILGFLIVSGEEIVVAGINFSEMPGQLVAVAAVVFGFTFSAWAMFGVVTDRPGVCVDDDELTVVQFPRTHRIARSEIGAIAPPRTTSLMFGNSVTSISVRTKSGSTVRIFPRFREASPDRFYEVLIRWWREGAG